MINADDLTVEVWGDGAAFYIKAHAGARRDSVSGLHNGMLKVEVTTAPEKGKANKAIIKLLAKAFKQSASDFELLSGETNSRKHIGVRALDPDGLREIVLSLL